MVALPDQAGLFAFQAIEDAFVAQIRSSPLGPLLSSVETLPSSFTAKEVGDRLRKVPGAFVAFSRLEGAGDRRPRIDVTFNVFAVTGAGAQEEVRRRGSKVAMGAETLLQMMIVVLHGRPLPEPMWTIPGGVLTDQSTLTADSDLTADAETSTGPFPIPGLIIGTPYVGSASAYWSEDVDALGLSIYGAEFTLDVQLPPLVAGDVTDFLMFRGQVALGGVPAGGVSLPLPDSQVSSDDLILLPAADE